MHKKRLILVVLIIVGVWYFWGKDWMAKRSQVVQAPAGAKVEESVGDEDRNPSPPPLTLRGGEGGEGKARVHYFTKEALASCSTETVALEQVVDPKYGHAAAGALVAQTLPLSADAPAGYTSAFASGTRLLTMRLDQGGVATANYNSQLLEGLNDCNKAQRRAQIERTLKEFSEVKEVQITVNGATWE